MKYFTLIATLIGALSATELTSLMGSMSAAEAEAQIESAEAQKKLDTDNHLAQLVTSALAGAPPGEIHVPDFVQGTTKEGDKTTTNGYTYKNYQYFWKFVCAFTKWIPTNQFLHAGKNYVAAEMTLERFGFIGTDKKCFWGMVGVKWITPLKVEQMIPNAIAPPAPAPKA